MEENKQEPKEESIFQASDFSERYDKHVKNARTALYVVAGLIVLGGLITTVLQPNEMLLDIWIEVVIVAGIFFVLAVWSNMKPYAALLTGLIIYILYQLLYLIIDPANIVRGIIVKIIIVVYLIRGISNAREAERFKETLKK